MQSHEGWRRLHVVILEDDEDLAALMQETMVLRGHTVSLAHELQAAWREIATNTPDVFVADFWIGRETSASLLAAVRVAFVEIRCVLVSASSSHEWAHLLEQGLVQDVLKKPFREIDLVTLVEGPCARLPYAKILA
jgi:DNA-binding NtrC family response regulator